MSVSTRIAPHLPYLRRFARAVVGWDANASAVDLHALSLYFTDPATGEVKVVKAKVNSKPYGVKFGHDGTPWVACNGAPCLYKVDRDTMDLPGAQDELIRRVVGANSRTAVLVNTGSPVTMPWADTTPAIVQMWFGGQEMAEAAVDVLVGDDEPSGRLPTTFPLRLEHNPSFGNFPGEDGEVRYGEGLLMGYRWYETRHLPVRFAFGHGGSYTTFDRGPVRVTTDDGNGNVTLEVDVTNTGARRGADVVQCYVRPPHSDVMRPAQELKAFEKIWLDPGERATVTLQLDPRSFAHWSTGDPGRDARDDRSAATAAVQARSTRARTPRGWAVVCGAYTIAVGHACDAIDSTVTIDVAAQSC